MKTKILITLALLTLSTHAKANLNIEKFLNIPKNISAIRMTADSSDPAPILRYAKLEMQVSKHTWDPATNKFTASKVCYFEDLIPIFEFGQGEYIPGLNKTCRTSSQNTPVLDVYISTMAGEGKGLPIFDGRLDDVKFAMAGLFILDPSTGKPFQNYLYDVSATLDLGAKSLLGFTSLESSASCDQTGKCTPMVSEYFSLTFNVKD